MEVIPRTEFILKLSEQEFKLLTACVAQCAGIKTRVDPLDANKLNLSLLASETSYRQEQARLSEVKLAKAQENVAIGELSAVFAALTPKT